MSESPLTFIREAALACERAEMGLVNEVPVADVIEWLREAEGTIRSARQKLERTPTSPSDA